MKERGILMTQKNIQATIEDRKTMTRRVIKPQPPDDCGHIRVELFHPTKVNRKGEEYPGDEIFGAYSDDGEWGCKCPYGQVGDFLYLKEVHYRYGYWGTLEGKTKKGKDKWRFSGLVDLFGGCFRYLENPPSDVLPYGSTQLGWYKRSPLFMPKKYARHWYEIIEVRAERLWDISPQDCLNEGIRVKRSHAIDMPEANYNNWLRVGFIELWDSINKARGHPWANNEWVWPISYKAVSHG